ncbi:MAG: hypothetical protein ACFFCZ_02665 [Promethearchaeota archaeon]
MINDPIIKQINSLNTDEIVKDILEGWHLLHTTYPDEIRRYQLSSQAKETCQQLARKLYEKYTECSTKAVWEEEHFNNWWSVRLYHENRHLGFSYPINLILAESLDPHLLYQILQSWPLSHITGEEFIQLFWQKKRAIKNTFSQVDLQLLRAIFSNVETKSCIGFPTIPELWQDGWHFSRRTARARYQRLQNLAILTRHSIINYAKIGLTPYLKIYDRTAELSDVERHFCTWESNISPNQILRILALPRRSTFWWNPAWRDGHKLHLRVEGFNINVFDGVQWHLDISGKKVNKTTHREIDYTADEIKFRYSDLHLLHKLFTTGSRQVKPLINALNYQQGYISRRFKELREANVFVPSFRLWNTGLTEQCYIFTLEKDLLEVEQFIQQFPRYDYVKAQQCLYARVWIPLEIVSMFLNACSSLEKDLGLKNYHYGRVNNFRVFTLDFPELLSDKKQRRWFSEY